MLSISLDRTVRIWEEATGNPLRTLEYVSDCCMFSFLTDRLALMIASEDNRVRVWDLTTEQPPQALDGDTSKVTDISISPDHHYVASSSDDGVV